MSALLEDRLAAALRARAEQVQPEDLGPVEMPSPGGVCRGARCFLGSLPQPPWPPWCCRSRRAARSGEPQPAPPTQSTGPGDPELRPGRRRVTAVRDNVTIDWEQSKGSYAVVVDLTGG